MPSAQQAGLVYDATSNLFQKVFPELEIKKRDQPQDQNSVDFDKKMQRIGEDFMQVANEVIRAGKQTISELNIDLKVIKDKR
jgi:flagellar basal body rod protein FlgB